MVRIFSILGLLCSIFCFSNRMMFNSPFFLIPFVYTICTAIYIRRKRDFSFSPGLIALHIAMFMRYVVVIFSYYLNNSMSLYTVDYNYTTQATYLMVYEMIAIFIATDYLSNKSRNKKVQVQFSDNTIFNTSPIGIIIVGVILVLLAGSFLHLDQGYRVFLSGAYADLRDIEAETGQGTHYIDIIWETLCVWWFVYFICSQQQLYKPKKNNIFIVLSVIISLIFIVITFIGQTSINRWYTIMTALSLIALLTKLYPNKRKGIAMTIFIPLGLIIMLATLIKNAGYEAGATTVGESLKTLFNPSEMDSYFAGPVGVGNAITVAKLPQSGLSMIFGDVFRSIPLIGRLFDSFPSSLSEYWRLQGRGDLINPLIGQSVAYFGYILSPILSIFCVYLIFVFDRKYKQKNSYLTYIYAFCGIWFAIVPMMLNLTIGVNWFFIRIIPFSIALYITNKWSMRKRLQTKMVYQND